MTASADVNPASSASEAVYAAAPVRRPEHRENLFTSMIEQQTAKVPSSYFLFAAMIAMTGAAALEFTEHRRLGNFVARWPAPLLIMGLYNKFVKTMGPR